jgi:PPOX class probable F420-dependent enzyme
MTTWTTMATSTMSDASSASLDAHLDAQIPEAAYSLLAGAHTAILSTITPSGAVQSTAIWFVHDVAAGTIVISITDARKKFRNLNANGTATFFLLDPANIWSYVEIRGSVTIEADPAKLSMAAVAAKHNADISAYDQPGQIRQKVTLTPTRVNFR